MRTSERGDGQSRLFVVLAAGALLLLSTATAGPEEPFTVESPVDGAVVGAVVAVRGTLDTEPGSQGVLRVNGQDVAVTDGRFETELKATKEGPLSVRVQFALVGLPARTVERKITVDLTPPVLEVHEPPVESSEHETAEATVQGEVRDAHLVGLRMNGAPVDVGAEGTFRATFLLPSEGEVRVRIEATDAAGHRTEVLRVLRARPGSARTPSTVGPDPEPTRRPAPLPPRPTAFVPEVVVSRGRDVPRLRDDDGEHVLPDRVIGPNALASLRAALRRISWTPPPVSGVASAARPLVIEGPGNLIWPQVEAVARLARQPGVEPSAVLLRLEGETASDVAVEVVEHDDARPGGSDIALGLRGGGPDPRRFGDRRVLLSGLGEDRVLTHNAEGWLRNREAVFRELTDLIRRRGVSPASRGWVEAELSGAHFGEVHLLCRALATAGVGRVSLVLLEPEWSYYTFGESRPIRDGFRVAAPPREAQPPQPAAPAPPPSPADPDAVAFAFRSDRARARSLGGTDASEQALLGALRWLAAHVAPDGGWEAAGFPARCSAGAAAAVPPDGVGLAVHDVGVTGLALAAFLAAGYGPRGEHEFAGVVRRGLSWLRAQQHENGCFPHPIEEHYVYGHAAATTAMVEAHGMTGSRPYAVSAQRALDFIARARNPEGVWRYDIRSGENDTSVTSWMAVAIRAAEMVNASAAARGKPKPFTLDSAAPAAWAGWIAGRTARDGKVDYGIGDFDGAARPTELRYGPVSRAYVDVFPSDRSEGPTASALLLRLWGGEGPGVRPVEQGITRCLRRLPAWKDDGSIDFDYWYFATLALFQAGGLHWKTWNGAMLPVLVRSQRRDGGPCGFAGSWDPLDAWGFAGGRIYSTAMGALILATPNRFERHAAPK